MTYLKRPIGVPGDRVRVREDKITINGVPVPTSLDYHLALVGRRSEVPTLERPPPSTRS